MTNNFLTRPVPQWTTIVLLLTALVFGIPFFASLSSIPTDDDGTKAMLENGQRAVALFCLDQLEIRLIEDLRVQPEDFGHYQRQFRARPAVMNRVTEAFPECRSHLFIAEVMRHLSIRAAFEQQAAAQKPQEGVS